MSVEYLKKSYVQKRQNLRFLKLIHETFSSVGYQPALALDVGGADGYVASKIKEFYPLCGRKRQRTGNSHGVLHERWIRILKS